LEKFGGKVNTANKLTLFRVVMIPILLVVLYWGFHYSSLVGAVIFLIASATDFMDGYIARNRGMVTDFGKFMDPLADKVLVFAAMLWFTELGIIPGWATLIVLMREFAVIALRLIAVSNGKVIAAAWSGKIKTAVTMICLTFMFFVADAMYNTEATLLTLESAVWIKWISIVLIVITTLYSGVEYFVKNKNALDWSKIK